jgi:hypothetical protein
MRAHLVTASLGLILAVAACSSGGGPAHPATGGEGGFPPIGGSGGSGPDPACDVDGDGVASTLCGGADCDDGDASVHPGATEICDGRDNTCEGAIDEGCTCSAGDLRACATVASAKRNVGACHDGYQRCLADGSWSSCEGESTGEAEGPACDGVDQDCDGQVDTSACTACPGGGPEVCGNGLDDDCDGQIDNAELCNLDCSSVNPRDAAGLGLGCCTSSPPATYSALCADGAGLPACTSDQRACLDLDGKPGTSCVKQCQGTTCMCGRPDGHGDVVGVADCGFYTPCAHIDCDGLQNQPCYSGAPATLGVGICHGGRHSCIGAAGSRSWDLCENEQKPQVELCGNGLDDDCDGKTDEEDGATGRPCALRAACQDGAKEICGNGLDDDCDGFADEGCTAAAGAQQACWTGALLNRGIGICRDGKQVEVDGYWGPCEGQVLPGGEACGDQLDSDCNGLGGAGFEEDPGCCVPQQEICNGVDDDCDGLADDGVLTRCGTCGGSCELWEMSSGPSCTAPGSTCQNVAPFELDSTAITLSPGAPKGSADKVFVTSYAGSSFTSNLIVVDARSGIPGTPIALGYYVYSLVASVDGTVWLSSYGGAGAGALEHRDGTGRLLCSVDLGSVYSVGVDASGDAWPVSAVVASTTYEVHHISGKDTTSGGDTPGCKILDLTPGDAATTGLPVNGSGAPVEDASHYLWFAGGFGASSVQRMDLLAPTPALEDLKVDLSSGTGGYTAVGPDGAIYISSPMRRLDPNGPFDGTSKSVSNLGGQQILGFGFAPDGTLWGLSWSTPSSLVHMGLPSGAIIGEPEVISGSAGSYGIAIDGSGKIWYAGTSGSSSEIRRYDPLTGGTEPILQASFGVVYAGSTAMPLLEAGRRRGTYTHLVDGGGYSIRWHDLSWNAYVPAASRVAVQVRFADSPDQMDGSPVVCGPFAGSPADLSGCSGSRRFARVEVSLAGYGEPSVGGIKLSWDRR